MTKNFLMMIAFLTFANVYSQEEGKFRVGLDFGVAIPTAGGVGALSAIEPKYNLKDNMNIGLRMGIAGMVRDIQGSTNYESAKVSANTSYLATFDYYFNNSGGSFVPFVGAGAGYYSFASVVIDNNSNSNGVSLDIAGKFAGMARAGFEWHKFRMGAEYNFVPESDLQNTAGEKVGTTANSYFGVSLGFFVGGGKWGQ